MNEGLKKYEVEKGRIQYKVTGDASGEELFVFDRFGWRSLKKRTMEFENHGIKGKETQHEITDGKIVYRINHRDSTYRKRIDIRWSSLAAKMTPDKVSESLLFSLGGTQVTDSTLLNKKCQVWVFENRSLKEMWVWKGLVMKRISSLGEKNIITIAESIDLEAPISDDLFKLPSIYQLVE